MENVLYLKAPGDWLNDPEGDGQYAISNVLYPTTEWRYVS